MFKCTSSTNILVFMAKMRWQGEYHKSPIFFMQMSMSIWNQLLRKAPEIVRADDFPGRIDILPEKGYSSLVKENLKERLKSAIKVIRV